MKRWKPTKKVPPVLFTVLFLPGLQQNIIGNPEVFSGWISSGKISFGDCISFQVLALAGNAVGGFVCVGLLKYRSFVTGVLN